jgi:hypothetical protein
VPTALELSKTKKLPIIKKLQQLTINKTNLPLQVDFQVSGVPGSLESNGNLNGWVLEVAYRLPLNNIF